MNMSSMNSRLLWKETRQLMPLALSLTALVTALTIWIWFLDWEIDFRVFSGTLVLLPILFAYSAGAVLVSKEKETKSIQWLVSLPIPARYLILHQFFVALVGVGVLWLVWLCQFLLQLLFNANLFRGPTWVSELCVAAILLTLTSVYLVICSFAVAWISRAPILGLFSVLPLSVLPYLCAFGATHLYNKSSVGLHQDGPAPAWLIELMLLLGIGIVGTIGYRVAISHLTGRTNRSPLAIQLARTNYLSIFTETVLDYFRGDSQNKHSAPSAARSLFWQFRVQNQGIVLAILTGFVLCMPIASHALFGYRGFAVSDYRGYVDQTPFILAMSIGIVWCALCWMALIAFHGDQVNSRIRFVAEQGVSPTLVWVTRQIVPFAFLIAYVSIWIYCLPPSNDEWFRRSLRTFGSRPSISDILVTCGIMYAVSQWLGQVVRSAAIAAIVAPFAAIMVLLYASYCERLLASPWMVVSCGLVFVPILATWWMTPRWMDCRFGWRYWIPHSAFLLIMLVIPFVTYAQWKLLGL
jgi:ABC-type transport system involved in multi-copper enzyme maturation permease subunit